MSPTIHNHTFYYLSHSKQEAVKLINSHTPGHTANGILPLYHDEQLTQIAGKLLYKITLLDNSKPVPIISAEHVIITNKGSIKYSYVRNSYKPITIFTEETSGKFRKGTTTRSYVTADKSVRKLVYKSLE